MLDPVFKSLDIVAALDNGGRLTLKPTPLGHGHQWLTEKSICAKDARRKSGKGPRVFLYKRKGTAVYLHIERCKASSACKHDIPLAPMKGLNRIEKD